LVVVALEPQETAITVVILYLAQLHLLAGVVAVEHKIPLVLLAVQVVAVVTIPVLEALEHRAKATLVVMEIQTLEVVAAVRVRREQMPPLT
jgi:hypothetical protein